MRTIRLLKAAGIVCIGLSLLGRAAAAQDSAKPDEAPKKPSSIFDFGIEPIGPGPGDGPTKPDQEKAKTDADKIKTPDTQPPKGSVPPVEKPGVISDEMAGMLKACHVSPDGVITVDREMSFVLKGTEGKDFIVSGEFYPAPGKVLNNSGGMVFYLRERSGTVRYQFSITGIFAKRVLLEGKLIPRFASPVNFEGLAREEWHPFRVEFATAGITVQMGDQKGVAKGPLDVVGRNRLVLAPGAKLKNFKVEIRQAK
jgi:hypothetical protein